MKAVFLVLLLGAATTPALASPTAASFTITSTRVPSAFAPGEHALHATQNISPVLPGAPGEGPGAPPPVPLDGGLALLALAGAGLAGRRLRSKAIPMALIALFGAHSTYAQGAVLSPGDVAVVQLYTAHGGLAGGGSFALVTLVDLPQHTTFHVTNRGWDGTHLVAHQAGSTDLSYTAPCEVPAGTVLKVRLESTLVFESSGTCSLLGPTFTSGFQTQSTSDAFRLSPQGGHLIIFQSTAGSLPAHPGLESLRFLFAATAPHDFASGATSGQTIRIPPGLARGTTALHFPHRNTVYNGIRPSSPLAALRSGSRGEMLANFGSADNWTGSDTADLPAQGQLLAFVVGGNGALGSATATGGAGWRALAAPGSGLTVDALAAYSPDGGATTGVNFIQGLSDEMPSTADGTPLMPNLYVGYNGDNGDDDLRPGGFRANNRGFVPPNSRAHALSAGKGFLWYFWDVPAGPFTAQNGHTVSRELPVMLPTLGSEILLGATVTFTAAERTSARDGQVRPNGFYLLGNPFRQALDLSGLSEITIATMQQAFAFWNPSAGGGLTEAGSGTTGSYVVRNAASGITNSSRDDVQTWQGFFAEVHGATAQRLPTFYFDGLHRRSGSRPTFYGLRGDPSAEAQPPARLAFRLAGQTTAGPTYDEAAQLYFHEGGAETWDPHDLSDLGGLGTPAATLRPVGVGPGGEDGYALMQRGLPRHFSGDITMPLRLAVYGAGGSFTLSWLLDNVPDTWQIHLTDLATGASYDLRRDEPYTFAASEGTEDRFRLQLASPRVGEEADASPGRLGLSAPAPNPAAQAAFLTLTGDGGHVDVALFDALGRRMTTLFAGPVPAGGAQTVRVETGALPAGVYIVRATAGGQALARRLVVAR